MKRRTPISLAKTVLKRTPSATFSMKNVDLDEQ